MIVYLPEFDRGALCYESESAFHLLSQETHYTADTSVAYYRNNRRTPEFFCSPDTNNTNTNIIPSVSIAIKLLDKRLLDLRKVPWVQNANAI